METPFTWFVIRYEAPAGRSSVLLAGAVVTLLLAMSIVTALVPRTGHGAGTTQADRSDVRLEEEAPLPLGNSPTAGDVTPR
jgi:hypothetical protein